jgi:hypothetical protein
MEGSFEKLINDVEFNKKIDMHIREIMKDGKVDYLDIPEICFLVVDTINEVSDIELNENNMRGLIKLVLCYIVNKYHLVKPHNKALVEKLIDSSVKLVLIQPRLKSCIGSCFWCDDDE